MKNFLISILMISSFFSLNALNLEEAKQIALKNNPDLLAAEESNKASKNNLWKTYLSIAPSASVSGGFTRYDEEKILQNSNDAYDGLYNYQLVINQPIFNGGKVWLGAGLAKDADNISNESFKSARLNTISNLEKKYFSVLKNQALLDIANKNLQTSKTNTDIAKVKFESGSLSKAGYLQMQSEQANKEVSLIQVETLYQTSLLDLENFLSLEKIDELQEISADDYQAELQKLKETDMEEINGLVDEIMQIGKKENPTLRISELSVKTNNKSLLMAGGNFLPTLNLQYSKSWLKYDFEDTFNDNVGQLGINVSVPIFPLVDNGLEVAVARNKLKQAKYSLESTENNIALSIKSSVLNMVSAAKTVYSSKLALEYSAETYEQMKEYFANGKITANELLSAEIMYTSAQNQVATGFYDYLSAKSSLLALMGTEDENVLNNILAQIGME
ncbi:MAG: TolC family protein [Candidatus Cloacimonadales bacterium]|nr:TolC family protein [Candidatus Cloacimonadales bacterium]